MSTFNFHFPWRLCRVEQFFLQCVSFPSCIAVGDCWRKLSSWYDFQPLFWWVRSPPFPLLDLVGLGFVPPPLFPQTPPPFLTQGPHRDFFCHRHLEAPAPSGRDAVAPDRPAGGRAGGRWGVGCPSGGCYPPLTLHAPSTLCATGDMYASPQRSLTWQDCLCIFGPVTRDLGWVVGVNQVTPKSNHPTPDS